MDRPDDLPRSFRRVWELLSAADGETRSRRNLAARLQISTHTLQRILKDGDVPDLALPQSEYIRGSWVRTVTRIACGLGVDAEDLVRSTGTVIDSRVAGIIESERLRAGGADAAAGAKPGDRGCDLAGFILSLLSPGAGAGRDGDAARAKLQESIEDYLVASGVTPPGMADGEDLASGSFCRSCMTSLGSRHNRGASDSYCRWCSDSAGNLKPAGEVREVLTNWFMQWQKGISRDEAERRVRHYMLAMPAWSDLEKDPAGF